MQICFFDAKAKGTIRIICFSLILTTLLVFDCGVHAAILHADSEQSNHSTASDRYLQQGMLAHTAGHFKEAILQWRKVIKLLQSESDELKLANVYLHLADSLQELGRFAEAIDTLSRALKLVLKHDDHSMQIRITAKLGLVHLLAGNEKAAVRYITDGVKKSELDAAPALRAAVLNNLGHLYEAQREFDRAIPVYEDASAMARSSGNKLLAARTKVNLARILLQQKNYSRVQKELSYALELLSPLSSSHAKAFALVQVGQLYSKMDKEQKKSQMLRKGDALNKAFKSLTAAHIMASDLNDLRTASYAMGYLGSLFESEKRYDESLTYTRKALFAAQKSQSPEISYLWQYQTARILKATGNTNGSILAFERALQDLDSIKKDLAEECHSNIRNRRSYYQTVASIYFGLADLLLQRSAATQDENLRNQDLRAVIKTIERLKTVEIQDYFQDACVTAYLSQSFRLEALAANVAIIYPIVLPNRVEILLNIKNKIQQFTVQSDGRKLLQNVISLRTKIQNPKSQYLPQAVLLYNILIRPLEDQLYRQNIEFLVFVLDSTLRSIPMSVLHDGEHFLLHKFAIATTLGMTLTASQPIVKEKVKVLLTGLTKGVQGFPPLPYVSEEIRSISTRFEGELLQNENFTKANLEHSLLQESYSIIHIASHGQFDRDPKRTFLLTYDGKLTMDELEDLVSISRFRDNPVELLTLSACQTAIGDERAALGLAGIAVKAGARSSLASLWYVDDKATALLMDKFYDNLSRFRETKARALQLAQLALLKEMKYKHPAFWAPFIMIGNWF